MRIITISREFGSGGRELGRRLAEELQIAYYDQEIVAAMCSRSLLAEEYIRYMADERPLPLLPITTARTFHIPTQHAVTKNLSFYMEESRIIRETAEKSACVIVGRCGDYVLRHLNPVRVFVYADIEAKIARCRAKGDDAGNMTEEELCQKIFSIDKKRSRYYHFFTSQVWGNRKNYDLCINTASADLKMLAERLARLVEIL